tara:strand:- start:56118 stop:56771 length:654 start_codon:yes stop_codon:yes gene_type:complete
MKKKTKNKIIYVFLPILFVMALIVYLIVDSSSMNKPYTEVTSSALKQEDPKVTMIFSISCPHCYRMDRVLENWSSNKKHIDIEFIPATGSGWTDEARLFYTIKEVAGIRYKKIFQSVFDSYHSPQSTMKTFQDKIKYIASMVNTTPEKVMSIYKKSKNVEKNIEKSSQIMSDYNVRSVPQIIVNGKYKINQKYFSSFEEVFNQIEYLLRNENKKVDN